MKLEKEKKTCRWKNVLAINKSKKRDSCGIAILSSNGKIMEDCNNEAVALSQQFVSVITEGNMTNRP